MWSPLFSNLQCLFGAFNNIYWLQVQNKQVLVISYLHCMCLQNLPQLLDIKHSQPHQSSTTQGQPQIHYCYSMHKTFTSLSHHKPIDLYVTSSLATDNIELILRLQQKLTDHGWFHCLLCPIFHPPVLCNRVEYL